MATQRQTAEEQKSFASFLQKGRASFPPPLWALLQLSDMAVLSLPITGLWVLRLYESALLRQTESELVAQAAVLAGVFRAQRHLATPIDATNLSQRPGLDLADDPILAPPPEPIRTAPPQPQAAAIGTTLAPVLRDAQAVTLAAWQEVAAVLAGAPIASTIRRNEKLASTPGSFLRGTGIRVFVALPVQGANGVAGVIVLSRTPRDLAQTLWGKRQALAGLAAVLVALGGILAYGLSRLITGPLATVVQQAQRAARGGEIAPPVYPGTREVAELSLSLTRMAETLDKRARYITAFKPDRHHRPPPARRVGGPFCLPPRQRPHPRHHTPHDRGKIQRSRPDRPD
jgi:hypothetical protein